MIFIKILANIIRWGIIIGIILAFFMYHYINYSDVQKKVIYISDEPVPLVDFPSEKTELLRLLNTIRENHELPLLEYDDDLNDIAEIRLNELIISYSHTRPNGEQGYDLIDKTKWRGENLAKNYYKANEVLAAWCNSQPHLDNILFEEFTKVGIDFQQMSDGSTYWVMMFSN